jgi:hypothetical protein
MWSSSAHRIVSIHSPFLKLGAAVGSFAGRKWWRNAACGTAGWLRGKAGDQRETDVLQTSAVSMKGDDT